MASKLVLRMKYVRIELSELQKHNQRREIQTVEIEKENKATQINVLTLETKK